MSNREILKIIADLFGDVADGRLELSDAALKKLERSSVIGLYSDLEEIWMDGQEATDQAARSWTLATYVAKLPR